ncbi:hypothetical protein HBH47_015360 [Parastagonospora nodorum]|nr:hypothetical protein HBH51_084480 [Parastagonospora nodorum]KAH4130953.1 hypothetical protein HBH47_015360 [Parastagonospora nodorum]KAH5274425.1 hypothetical protein HBI71_041740 [Parastagonospora nodorum]KAH5277695.1 hypothetical protein HBI72_032670 [Parastagonospora nodorum]KAH6048393.1 hypothetical protein HBI54_064990 [Parastagonospora nodorum]
MSTKILLLGAGELGTALLPHLSLPHTHLTLGTRSPQNHTNLPVSTIALDLTSPSHTLAQTFSTFDILISATGFASSPSALSKLTHEVLEAGRLRKARGQGKIWFFPWQWGVDYDVTLDAGGLMPLFGAQKRVRDVLRAEAREAGVRWTVVSTGIFMSFLFEEFWGIVDRGRGSGRVGVRALRDWGHRVTVTDVSDIGRVVGRIVAGNVEAEDRVLYVAGETVSYGELAETVARVSGREVEREVWSLEYLEEEVKKDPEDGIKKYRLVFAKDGVWWDKNGTVNAALGMEMMGVEEYAKKLFEGTGDC